MKREFAKVCHCRGHIQVSTGNPALNKDVSNERTGCPVHAGHDSKERPATAGNDSINNQVILRGSNSGSQPYERQSGRDAEYQLFGMTLLKQGFTLIELLVVVLIIGILAAVALPQYQTAVDKARIMKYMPLGKSIKEAQELYYLENGEYSADLSKLSVQAPENCVKQTGSGMKNELVCEDSFFINNASISYKSKGELYIFYCPGYTANWSDCVKGNGWGLIFYFAHHPSKPNQIECNNMGRNRACKIINAQFK